MPTHKKSGSNVRLLRVNETLRHELAEVLVREDLHDQVFRETSVTVSEVRVSPDLRNATVFVMALGGTHQEEVLAALNRAAPYLSGLLCRRLHMKFSPKLRFVSDTTFDETDKLEKLLASPKVARDLDK